MRPGIDRSQAPYVWPSSLERPDRDVRIVYLDLNHWISLAKAAVDHRDGRRHQEALEAAQEAARSGRFLFPLSATHYMEMAGIADPRQRFDIAGVMEELSGFASFVSRSIVIQLELEAAVEDASGVRRAAPFVPVPIVGQGALQAFGLRGGLRIRSKDGDDATEITRQQWAGGPAAFDRWQREAELTLDRSLLRGPEDHEVAELQAFGWDGTIARRLAEERAGAERAQATRFAAEPRWRRGRTRDVVSARYMLTELGTIAPEALSARGLELDDVWGSPQAARRLIDSMPSADIVVSLLTAAHRNRETKFESNDIFDIDGLSVAVPYADIVVTDRHAHHTLHASGAPARCGTTVLATLYEFTALL